MEIVVPDSLSKLVPVLALSNELDATRPRVAFLCMHVVLTELENDEMINDGAMFSRGIVFSNSMKNVGAAIIREVACKTKESARDGSKTASILVHEIISNGLWKITSGANPVSLKNGMDKTVLYLIEELMKMSRPVKDSTTSAAIAEALVAQACYIAESAGMEGREVVEKVMAREWEVGFNVVTGNYENMFDSGVVDSTVVLRIALQAAATDGGYQLIKHAQKALPKKLAEPF